MSQATLGATPYRNSDLFSGYYLDERVDDLDAWDCDEDAQATLEELQHCGNSKAGSSPPTRGRSAQFVARRSAGHPRIRIALGDHSPGQ